MDSGRAHPASSVFVIENADVRTMAGPACPLRGLPRVVGTKVRTGIRLYPPGEAGKLVARAVRAGFSVATHATGNDAMDVALAAYEAAGSDLHRAGPPRLEHFLFASHQQVKRAADVGAVIVTQPNFLTLRGFDGIPGIPGLATMPLRWLLDAGVTVAASSDYPCAGLNPLDGIAAAVHRKTATRVHTPSQCVSIDEALRAYTRDAAKALGCDAECGSLEPGKRADLVVLDAPLRDEPDRLGVHATILGGAIEFGGLPFSAGMVRANDPSLS
jgi:predicted amidohydrolase YtcJ